MSKATAMLALEPSIERVGQRSSDSRDSGEHRPYGAPSRIVREHRDTGASSRDHREHRTSGAPSRTFREHRNAGAPWGALYCWVRQGQVRARQCWRPWWLLGLVEIVTYPEPAAERALFVPRMAASCGLPARAPMLVLLAARS